MASVWKKGSDRLIETLIVHKTEINVYNLRFLVDTVTNSQWVVETQYIFED
jgi:hypothetical protein